MSTGSSPHLTDWQSQDTQFTECHNATRPFYPPETYTRETSELRIQSTPPLALLVPPEVPIGDIQTRDAAHPYVTSSTSAGREWSVRYPTTTVSSTLHHKTPPDGSPGALVHHQLAETKVASRPIPTSYQLLSGVGQASDGLPSTYRPGRCDEGQSPVRLPSIQSLLSSLQPAQSASHRTSMTSGCTPSVDAPPRSHASGRLSEYHLMRPSQGGQRLTFPETRSEPLEQSYHPLSKDVVCLDWQRERSKFLMIPLGPSQLEGQRSPDDEPRPLHHREAIVNWAGQDHRTLTPGHPHANSSLTISGRQDKRKRRLDVPHEAPGTSKRAHVAHTTTSPRNQRMIDYRQQTNRVRLSEGIDVAPLGHAQPINQPVNAPTQTSVNYLDTGASTGGPAGENASSIGGLGELGGGRGGPMAATEPSDGFFRDAQGVVVHHPNMVDGTQNIFMQGDRSEEILPWLAEYTMRGAKFDSSDRDPPPRCHPGTRTTISNKIYDWLGSPRPEKKLLWLRGLAGVGKSAIVQTVAEKLADQGCLGASLFFSRTNGRIDPRQVFPTLAYQFAVQDPSYKRYIAKVKLKDPQSLEKAMGEQFRLLIGEPFGRNAVTTNVWVVTLDGLDECGGDRTTGRHSDDTQREILRLISQFVLQHPSTPLIWIIASRPETHLKTTFSEDAVKPSFWEEDVPIDSPEACRDVEKFLHDKFTEIQHHHSDHIHATTWPAQSQFLRIATAASGLFIFAEVIIRFIGDSSTGNPVAQLRCVISIISKVPASQLRRNPLAVLDALYGEILSRIPRDLLKVAKDLIGTLLFLDHGSVKIRDVHLSHICNFLNIARDDAVTALRHLHSVLFFPRVKDIGKTRPRFYHTSFRDFLEDPSRSNEYLINVKECGLALFWGSQALADATSCFRQISLSWPNNEDNDSKWLAEFTVSRIQDIFRNYSPCNCVVPFCSIHVPVPQTHLLSLLENVNYRRLLGVGISEFGYFMHRVVYEDGYEAALGALREHKIVTYATLPSLGVDKARLMNSTIHRETLEVLVELDKLVDTRDNLKDVVPLLQFMDLTPPIAVAIWGSKSSEHCAVMAPWYSGIRNCDISIFFIVGF